jgi:hypothetical protein
LEYIEISQVSDRHYLLSTYFHSLYKIMFTVKKDSPLVRADVDIAGICICQETVAENFIILLTSGQGKVHYYEWALCCIERLVDLIEGFLYLQKMSLCTFIRCKLGGHLWEIAWSVIYEEKLPIIAGPTTPYGKF